MSSSKQLQQTTETSAADLYGETYYATQCGTVPYERGQSHWPAFFGSIADALIRSFQPRRVFDAGCAHGFLVEAFWDRGVEAYGRDISTFAISQVRADLCSFCKVETLAAPIDGRYDLVTCIEVLEHMPETEALQAVEVLTAASNRVLFSSSPVDLAEVTHINVKPPIYWLQRFAACGFAPRMDYDPTFLTPWAILFERTEDAIRPADLNAMALLIRQRLHGMEAAQAISALQGQIAELTAASATVRAESQAFSERAEAARADAIKRAVNAADARIRDVVMVAESSRQHAEEADMRAAIALRDAKTMLEDARRQHASERAALLNEVQRLTHVYDIVIASSTWRAMAPLRAIGRRMPCLLRRRLRQIAKLVWWSATFQLVRRYGEWRAYRASLVVNTADPAAYFIDNQPALIPIEAPSLMPALINGLYKPPDDLLPCFVPLNVKVAPELEYRPVLNVLLPSCARKHLSGGPNTVLNIVCRLMDLGVKLRLISTDAPPDSDDVGFWAHVGQLIATVPSSAHAEIVDASDRSKPLQIGQNDLFLATAWWTAQMAKYAIRHTCHRRFAYIIQDYEPLLHPSSTQCALAEETYGLDYLPIVNTSLLHGFLASRGVGRFAHPDFAADAIIFEPAVDKTLFRPADEGSVRSERDAARRLLFYARPTKAQRNAYELGTAALQKLIAEGHLDPAAWEFVAMGENFSPVALGGGAELVPAPWLDLQGYADLMRSSDVLLSPMLSPHPSYPPLEMAACGRPVVTTAFGNKTASAMALLSPLIIAAEPTIEGLAAGLRQALRLVASAPTRGIAIPSSWKDSLRDVVPRLHSFLLEQFGAPRLPTGAGLDPDGCTPRLFPGYRFWPSDRYNLCRFEALAARLGRYSSAVPGLFTLVTTVWNTDPAFVTELAETVLGQHDCGAFEWLILDNGTKRADTRERLQRIATAAPEIVRLERVEENLGIIGGMRFCLERARNRYIVPLDSDDLLTPDALAIFGAALEHAGFPALAYSDEDKLLDGCFRDPYCKPDWDPVLFFHSCYIAHLCAIERRAALELGAYTDRGIDGSHDWDTFTTFYLAGQTPLHVPEVVYSWRMHADSTAGNIHSKDYIFASQKAVLQRFAASLPEPQRFRIEHSPLFGISPDWRFVRDSDPTPTIRSIRLLAGNTGMARLLAAVEAVGTDTDFIHLLDPAVTIEDEVWSEEALSLFHAFPDTALIGGRVHRDGVIVAADGYEGFSDGLETPNAGRSLSDPGYFAQMWKPHSADVVPVQHCVVRRMFLRDALSRLVASGASMAGLSGWLGVHARMARLRVIYSPFFRSVATVGIEAPARWEQEAVRLAFARLPQRQRLLSLHLGRTRETAYRNVIHSRHGAWADATPPQPVLDYPSQHRAERIARQLGETVVDAPCRFSLVTTLYSRSRAMLLQQTARSVAVQGHVPHEWIILEKGDIPSDTRGVLDELDALPWVRHLVSRDLSIINGMRHCLEHATGEYVIPMDYDDVLTDDALAVLACAIERAGRPGLVYSDEDLLSRERLHAPYRRAAFDPILNAIDSTIWHLCAFKLERARNLGVYTTADAELCHDWDTVSRFAATGEQIYHVPEVLYHWRVHENSSSNSGTINEGSLTSVRAMLGRVIARQRDPSLYEVAPCPIWRGSEQYTVLRRPSGIPMVTLILIGNDRVDCSQLYATLRLDSEDAVTEDALREVETDLVLVLTASTLLPTSDAIWEAVRLFEMHDDVGAVGGRVLNADGIVLESCVPVRRDPKAEWVGRHRTDGGAYAVALKPQSVVSLPESFFFCRTDILRAAATLSSSQAMAFRVSSQCRTRGLRLAYSPLVEAAADVLAEIWTGA